MNDATNPPTGQGMTHEQVQRFEASLRETRDQYFADADTAPILRVEYQSSARAIQLVLSFLHIHSGSRYGEPYPHPETEGQTDA